MTLMRTISGAVEYIKSIDPDSAITAWWLRQMVKSGKLKHHMAGNRYLIDVSYLIQFLNNPPEGEKADIVEYGKLRQVKA